ncbi:receptor-like protein kinase FERONIA [Castanea sativa]|uniref:receptor-like protein kinase FERONIA n=1 Tax=Castanea sativa TaxID=21020 RepID=UPI003F650524
MEGVSKLFRTFGKRAKPSSTLPKELCRRFSLAEMKIATNNFDDKLLIDLDSFAKVYKGLLIDDCSCTINVAIKCVTFDWSRTEVVLACQLHHPNHVPLIGYCLDDQQMILVYEFMVNGNLGDHLYGTATTNHHGPLQWKQRLQICIEVARALHYLHTGLKHTIIHRNVKPSNILLDEKWEAKLGDLGLSKLGPPSLSKALIKIESQVVGTYGYADPGYVATGELTDKSDVYSFGVVLLEVLCGRKAFQRLGVEEHQYLVNWARKCKREGTINKIIDPYLMGKIAPECFKIYLDIATSCVRNDGKDRPTIGEVEIGLEHALQLQQSADAERKDGVDQYNYTIVEYISSTASPEESFSGVYSTTT